MMPKGVEHKTAVVMESPRLVGVRIPMMPKGVEHGIANEAPAKVRTRENSNDAERR